MSDDVRPVLETFYGEALARLLRHQASARVIRQYDVNNTYQYIINREEAHLSWVGSAIASLGGAVDDSGEQPPADDVPEKGDAAARRALEADAKDARDFVERWRPRVRELPNARHAKMLGVILGEVLEQERFFEQALAGRTDLLGRRGEQAGPAEGEVLPSRWIE